MIHTFDVDTATEYGVTTAILFNYISFWIDHNVANETNYYDEEYWTYNSINAFKELFPYLGEKALRTALSKMEEQDLIKTGNYNKSTYDRTKWYALAETGKSIRRKGQVHLPKRSNGSAEKGEPIPVNNTVNKHIYVDFFNQLWDKYPIKKGKASISDKQIKALYSIGIEEMARAIQRYVKEQETVKAERKYWKHGSTFFNSGYVDYLDANYEDKPQETAVRRVEIK